MDLNKHRRYSDVEPDKEFNEFYLHYAERVFDLDREALIEGDPFALVDGFYDEALARTWASNKLFGVRADIQCPTYYNVDRDIAHPTAFDIAAKRGLAIEPGTVSEILHDMQDAARFEVEVQTKTDKFLDMLIDFGEPGIRGFLSLGWDEGEYFGTGYYPAVEMKKRLQDFSTSPPEGQPGSISLDFTRLLHEGREVSQLHEWYTAFDRIPFGHKRFLVLKLADLAGTSDIHQLSFEVGNATFYTDDDDNLLEELADILYVHYVKMDSSQADLGGYVMAQLLTKLDRHPRYREIFVPR